MPAERDSIRTRSTSKASAIVEDVVLRETSTTRLVFRPTLVDNPSDDSASVHGMFLFQRKSPTEAWEDTETIPLTSLKKDEGFRLDLHASEILELFGALKKLYDLHAVAGVPQGEGEFVRVDERLAAVARMTPEELTALLAANDAVGSDLLSRLLSWAAQAEDPALAVERLLKLSPEGLQALGVAVNVHGLRSAVQSWDANQAVAVEEFWQNLLTENTILLEHVFSWPTAVIKDKAYVGGKSVMNTGGGVVDFLVKNQITKNVALIEIKTPVASLLGSEYRDGVFVPSEDLSGAIAQVLRYRHTLQEDFRSLQAGLSEQCESFAPRCVVIIGNATEELRLAEQVRSFELFREQFTSVQIITFDELFSRAQNLLDLLESPGESLSAPGDDEPF